MRSEGSLRSRPARRGRLSFAYFSLAKQRKVSASSARDAWLKLNKKPITKPPKKRSKPFTLVGEQPIHHGKFRFQAALLVYTRILCDNRIATVANPANQWSGDGSSPKSASNPPRLLPKMSASRRRSIFRLPIFPTIKGSLKTHLHVFRLPNRLPRTRFQAAHPHHKITPQYSPAAWVQQSLSSAFCLP